VLLVRTGQTQDAIAAEIGVSRVAVSHWMAGTKRPAAPARKLLAERFKVPVEAWEQDAAKARGRAAPGEAEDGGAKTRTRNKAAELLQAVEELRRPAAPDGVLALADELMADLREGLDELRKDDEALPLEKARVRASLGQTLAILGKVTGAFDLGSRFFRLPIWRQIEGALGRGLAGHPEAAAAVARELRRVEAETGYKRP
jgi:transcriptional regulator with XRE-family HTH domain